MANEFERIVQAQDGSVSWICKSCRGIFVSQTIPRHHVCQSLVGRTPIPGEKEMPSFMPNFHTPIPDAATNVVHPQSTPRSRFERDPPYDFHTIQEHLIPL